MEINNPVLKNELYVYDFGENPGSIQSGIRPVLIVQGNEFNKHSPTVIVAPITTAVKKQYLPSHIYLGDDYGLAEPSMVLLEQIRTVNQSELGKYIGHIDDNRTQKQIWFGLRKTFGAWDYNKNKSGMVYTLCPVCLSNMRSCREWNIRRNDPFQNIKEPCTKCGVRYGYDYLVTDRK